MIFTHKQSPTVRGRETKLTLDVDIDINFLLLGLIGGLEWVWGLKGANFESLTFSCQLLIFYYLNFIFYIQRY